MNSINLTNRTTFPLDVETLEFLQEMIRHVYAVAGIGGSNYILSGCEERNGTISPGLLVVDGELVAFAGGVPKERIRVLDTVQSVEVEGEIFREAYLKRTAEFSDTGNHKWADFRPVPTNAELAERLSAITGDAVGVVKMWAGQPASVPADYRLCDGQALLIKDYPALYETLGVGFGGDGRTSFNLPDLRGRFVVGYNNADADYNAIGRTGGDKTVRLETKHLPRHDHRATADGVFNKLSARAADVDATNTPGAIDSQTPAAEYRVGGMTEAQWKQSEIKVVGEDVPHENRPPYFTLAYIIKVK